MMSTQGQSEKVNSPHNIFLQVTGFSLLSWLVQARGSTLFCY